MITGDTDWRERPWMDVMSDESQSPLCLDGLGQEAQRWRDALAAGDPDARARLRRVLPNAPEVPTLVDVRHALALEHGFAAWAALEHAIKEAPAGDPHAGAAAIAQFQVMADALLEAYRTGTPDAMERHYRYTWHRRAWRAMRTYVQLDLGKINRPWG